MQFPKIRVLWACAFLLFSWNVYAQDKVDREVEIHDNVKLIIMAPASDLPEAIRKDYQAFLPLFEKIVKENTTKESDECALTLRIAGGMREIGSAKTQRPYVRVTSWRRNSRQEFVGTFIIYSYITSGPVNKEETEQFFTKQILEPAQCAKGD